MRILLLPLIITILAWVLKHNADKRDHTDKHSVRSYLDRESAANSVRRQDISALPYIQAPVESFPFDITLNDPKKQLQIDDYKKEILSCAKRPMLNLTGISNTELKEAYGPANLDILSTYDQNYSMYTRNLFLYAQTIYEEYPAEAAHMLEYCIQEGTDISGVYALLGQYYQSQGNRTALSRLYDSIPDADSISGKMIRNKLDQLK
ncbi:MAG: hypothetical protein J6A03_08040 [Lachnospiraceae bacterium]|nr:hypothetical protein [Lachnospiraceae bacterium]